MNSNNNNEQSIDSILDSYLNGKIPLDNLYNSESSQSSSEIKALRETYNNKLKEIEELTKLIEEKDNQISLLKQNKNYNDLSNYKINAMTKKLKNLELENQNELSSNMQQLKSDYLNEINSIKGEHDLKIEKLKSEIEEMKNKISVFKEKKNYIGLDEYQKILEDLKTSHKEELIPYEKEIFELEKFISENYPEALDSKGDVSEGQIKSENSNFDVKNFYSNIEDRGFKSKRPNLKNLKLGGDDDMGQNDDKDLKSFFKLK